MFWRMRPCPVTASRNIVKACFRRKFRDSNPLPRTISMNQAAEGSLDAGGSNLKCYQSRSWYLQRWVLIYCPFCSRRLYDHSHFCDKCGRRIPSPYQYGYTPVPPPDIVYQSIQLLSWLWFRLAQEERKEVLKYASIAASGATWRLGITVNEALNWLQQWINYRRRYDQRKY